MTDRILTLIITLMVSAVFMPTYIYAQDQIQPQNDDQKRFWTAQYCLGLINDANKYRMDLTTNGTLVMDSVKIVQNQLDYLNGMEKKLSQINNNNKRDRELEEEDNIVYDEEQQQQKNTTNGIF